MSTDVSRRYPERMSILGQVFNNVTSSYKLIWFQAILARIRDERPEARVSLRDLFVEMAVIAWAPVCLYRLSFGPQDKLQRLVVDARRRSELEPNAAPRTIRAFIQNSPEASESFDALSRYVPTRFLNPWFAEQVRGERDTRYANAIMKLAKDSQTTESPSPYWFDGESIQLNETWKTFLADSLGLVSAFCEFHFAQYLQAHNPNVPGIIYKLHAGTQRQLGPARKFWQIVRERLTRVGRADLFCDIYTNRPLADTYAIDHFLPWTFVAHDLLWNLVPVETLTNSSKNDALPDFDEYLPRLAVLHREAILAMIDEPRYLESHAEVFKLDVAGLAALSIDALTAKYREVVVPQSQIAINLGFRSGWRYRHGD